MSHLTVPGDREWAATVVYPTHIRLPVEWAKVTVERLVLTLTHAATGCVGKCSLPWLAALLLVLVRAFAACQAAWGRSSLVRDFLDRACRCDVNDEWHESCGKPGRALKR